MAMEINGNRNLIDLMVNKQRGQGPLNYSYYSTSNTNTTKKCGGTKESNVTTSTVEMKTSTPGVTRTEQIKTGYKNVNDYSRYLQEKYSYMNTGTTSMQGVPTTVSVSSAFLKKCMNDPEKAKYLEENLAAIPDCVKSLVDFTKTMPGNPVCTYATYIIGDDGNITCMGGCTNDPDGKIARENAERRAQEKKEAEEKAAKRRAEKKAAEEARTETGNYTVSATGTDVKAVTQKIIAASLGTSANCLDSLWGNRAALNGRYSANKNIDNNGGF